MTDAPYKAERLKTKPLPLIPRRRKKAKNVTSSAKTAIKRAILRPSAGQKVAAMKEEDQSVKARTTIRKTVTRAPQPRLKSSNPISKHGPPLTNGETSSKVLLKDALYAPDLALTVVSIGRIAKAGYTVQFPSLAIRVSMPKQLASRYARNELKHWPKTLEKKSTQTSGGHLPLSV